MGSQIQFPALKPVYATLSVVFEVMFVITRGYKVFHSNAMK